MRLKQSLIAIASSVLLFSCVSQKKYKDAQARYDALNVTLSTAQGNLSTCNEEKSALNRQKGILENDVANLNKQIDFLKQNNTQALKQLEDLSVITGAQAESIRKSMENIGAKDSYIQTL